MSQLGAAIESGQRGTAACAICYSYAPLSGGGDVSLMLRRPDSRHSTTCLRPAMPLGGEVHPWPECLIQVRCFDLHGSGPRLCNRSRNSFTALSHKRSGLRSPALASSIILLAISSFAISPRSASPRASRVISNARPMMRLVSGSNLEVPKNCEMGMEMGPAIGGVREAAPSGHGGRCTAGGPGQLRLRSREPPNWYVARCSNEVQLRTGHKWPQGARCNAVSVGLSDAPP